MQFVARLPIIERHILTLLRVALETRFGDHTLLETRREELKSLRMFSQENLHEFAARVKDMVARAYPGVEGSTLYSELCVNM
jgi:hypothetical protein